ncbi:MAG: hypothetical protein FWH20_04285 [Oscillospiraceae bacterium]|nr:hypothetical protein [Oscillospiraceae bacterium]
MSKKKKRNNKEVTARQEQGDIRGKGGNSQYWGSVRFFKHLILSFVALAVIVPTVIAVMLALGDKNEEILRPEIPTEHNGRAIVAAPENIDELLAGMESQSEDTHYKTQMTVEWEFERWNRPSTTAYVENSVDNSRTVYFDVALSEGGDVVYSSPYLERGAKVQGFALDKKLSAGEYPAIVTYYLVDDDYIYITELSVAVLLKILG